MFMLDAVSSGIAFQEKWQSEQSAGNPAIDGRLPVFTKSGFRAKCGEPSNWWTPLLFWYRALPVQCNVVLTDGICCRRIGVKTRRSTNWWSSAKRDLTHLTATVVFNACYHLFRKRSCIPVHRLAWAS